MATEILISHDDAGRYAIGKNDGFHSPVKLVTPASTDTLTNKSLTSPVITGASLSLNGDLTGADTAALVFGGGTSTTPLVMGADSANLIGYWATSANTGGDTRLFYSRLYFTAAGAAGEAQRIYTTVTNVSANTVRGLHCSLDFAATGKVTGLGVAAEFTLHVPTTAGMSGTCAAAKFAINSDGAGSDPAGITNLSYIRFDNQGDGTGGADVDDDANLFTITGHTIADDNMVDTTATAYALAEITHGIKINVGGTTLWLLASSTNPKST